MWRIVTFNFTGKGTYEGTFAIEVDNSGVPITAPGRSACIFINISGDAVETCTYGDDVVTIENQTLSSAGVLRNFSSAVEGQTYTESDPTGNWSYTNATTYTITAAADSGGSISPSGEISVFAGESQVFTIIPDEGYRIGDVFVDGVESSSQLVNNTYTFTNVQSDHQIIVKFEELPTYVIEIQTNCGTGALGNKNWNEAVASLNDDLTVVASSYDNTTQIGTVTITSTGILPAPFVGVYTENYIISITLPDCFTEIEDAAFAGCENMVSITLPNTIEVIGADAFSECTSLTSLELPASVTEVGEGFLDACDSLEEVICLAPVPPTTGSTISTLTLPELQVPASSVSAYQSDNVWGSAFTVIKSTTPGPKPFRGYGFNTSGMVDLNYINEVFYQKRIR